MYTKTTTLLDTIIKNDGVTTFLDENDVHIKGHQLMNHECMQSIEVTP